MATTASPKPLTVHDLSRISPPFTAEQSQSQSLPLSYFDMFWVFFHPIQRLLFYKLPCSRDHFVENIVPKLKSSLAKALESHVPLAGKLYVPLNPGGLPEIRYGAGDSVSFTVAEVDEDFDFDYWTGNQARDADRFYDFVARFDEPKIDSDLGFRVESIVSVQVTLIPGKGVCVGFSNHHTIGDASSIVRFINLWSSIAKLGETPDEARSDLLPIFDKSVIVDPSRRRVNIFWSQLKDWADKFAPPKFPTGNFRQTFVLKKSDLQKLRNMALAKKPWLVHLSTFTVSTAYAWSCIVKAGAKIGEQADENEPEYFVIAVDARQRLEPPVPESYFGNCLACAGTESTHGELKGDEGFSSAVELIGDMISKRVNNKDELMKDADDWFVIHGFKFAKRHFGVAGSPKFDLYSVDFGWGKACKVEAVSIDGDDSLSLSKSGEFEGGLEIGLSMDKVKLDAFAEIFRDGLED